MSATGAPVVGALLTVSDAKTGEPIANARTDARGTFVLAGSTDVAITAMSPTGTEWAYQAHFSSLPPGEIRLRDDGCEELSGTVHGSARPERLDFARVSQEIGDSFAVAVGSDGAFRACLPPATYGFEAPPGAASPMVYTHTPITGLEITLETRATLELDATKVAGVSGETMAQFIASLPTTTELFAFGESNHGSREFFTERVKLALALAKARGVRIVMMESGYAESLPLDDYINGAKVDIAPAVAKLGYWPWDTKDFLAALADLRDANRKRPSADRLHFLGIDMQDSHGGIALLLDAHAVDDTIAATLQKLVEKEGAAWKTMADAERAPVIAALETIAARRDDRGGVSSKVNRLALSAHQLVLHLHALESADSWADLASRDRGMADLALDVLSRTSSPRAILWAHIGHLARASIVGEPSMGNWIAQHLGARYQVFVLLAAGGSARAWDAALKVGVIPHELPPPPPFSLEAMLGSHRAGPISYFRFAAASPPAAAWLTGLHAFRNFGAVHPRGDAEWKPFDLRALDGAVLFDEVHPTDPTPTGERHK